MSYQVRIEPSGHTFTALPHETLLDAALRSGINVNYNCSNGTCGDCRVRLLSGDVENTPADFRFSSLQKSEGYILLCSAYALTDLVIAAQEAHSAEDIPAQHIHAKVAKVEPYGENIRILHLRTPRTQTLRFLAGQHVCLHLPENKGSVDAAVASCPCNGMQLQFHLRREAGVSFVEHIFSDVSHGEQIEIDGPFGDVTLDDDSERPLVMVAVGEEFAPIKSLIEHAINLDLGQSIRLFWLAGPETGHYLENYCRAWGEVLDDYQYTLLNLDDNVPDDNALAELLAIIEEQVDELSQIDVYIAGPHSFQEALRLQLIGRGADIARVFLPNRRSSPHPLQRQMGTL